MTTIFNNNFCDNTIPYLSFVMSPYQLSLLVSPIHDIKYPHRADTSKFSYLPTPQLGQDMTQGQF